MVGTPSKLASTIADRIVKDIADLGWPIGHVVGSEPELLVRYGVSRAVFREAVRLVEHWQVASMRRGPGGGLVVTEPQVDAVVDAVVMYLAFVGVRVEEVFEARLVLEARVAELAPSRVTEADIIELRALAAREADGPPGDPREAPCPPGPHHEEPGSRVLRRPAERAVPPLHPGHLEDRPQRSEGRRARARLDHRCGPGR